MAFLSTRTKEMTLAKCGACLRTGWYDLKGFPNSHSKCCIRSLTPIKTAQRRMGKWEAEQARIREEIAKKSSSK